MQKLKKKFQEMHNILAEMEAARENMSSVISEIDSLDNRYMRAELEYKEYSKIKNKILSGRTKEQVVNSYNIYMSSLKNKLLELNSGILKKIHEDHSYDALNLGKTKKGRMPLPDMESLEIGEYELPESLLAKAAEEKTPTVSEVKKFVLPDKKKIGGEGLFTSPYAKDIGASYAEVKKPGIDAPKPDSFEFMETPKPVKLGFWKRLAYAFQAKEKPWLDAHEEGDVLFGGIFSVAFLKYLLTGKGKDRKMFGDTQILPSILSYENQGIDDELDISKTDILNPYLLEKQIKELKSLISKKNPETYKASTLGYIANITVRRISIYFIEKYPAFFKKLYKAIRFSGIRILANTYINIMFFLTLLLSIVSLPLFTVFFTMQGNTPFGVFWKTFLGFIFVMNSVFWMSYYYPFTRAKTRKRSINTNLPFAIDHMASVISSGVSPATMFKLISASREYGEISVELEKVTNYVEFFGYDILTALKSVALTTPSEDFKEFLDGFVSTIETGGNLKEYLAQKSSEALLNYRLERQKYVESLSTYSDIYTGVLIAAPLFFVTALSLVSMLGGTIGGMSVNTIITVGTYIAIPGLNLLFLIFLELNQPEI